MSVDDDFVRTSARGSRSRVEREGGGLAGEALGEHQKAMEIGHAVTPLPTPRAIRRPSMRTT